MKRPSSYAIRQAGRTTILCGFFFVLWPVSVPAQDGALQTIRDDVRNGPPAGSSSLQRDDSGHDNSLNSFFDNFDGSLFLVLAPFWAPIALLEDDYSQPGSYPRFPYDDFAGYLVVRDPTPSARPWSLRLNVDYADNFDRLDCIGSHLLLETVYRFGLDASADRLEERLPGGQHDELWLGDTNLVFRFAQSDWAEFRAGVGVNWLADRIGSDFGFNFTYGADFFPCKPWVLSSSIDCGTLGHAGLFRFRTTAGVVLHGVEVYTGYEYLDIEQMHSNSLIAGLRFWF